MKLYVKTLENRKEPSDGRSVNVEIVHSSNNFMLIMTEQISKKG